MTPAVSILVPVYNVSNYIERCAHSLFRQTFDDIEYVFVNDCTPDDSIEKLQKVIEQYPNRKPFIRIIHHEKNRGLAAARNTAIDNSTGKYIQHIDSDDWIEPDMIEVMYSKAETEQADIVVCDISVEFAKYQVVIENKDDNFHNLLLDNVGCVALWNKLIKKKLYELYDCKAPEGLNYREDRHSIIRLYFYANKITTIDRIFYHYNRTNETSITSNRTKYHFENTIAFWNLLDDFLKENDMYDKYLPEMQFVKIRHKALLFVMTNSYSLRKQYAYLFHDFEMKYISRLRFGEKLILFFTHYRMYALAQLAHWLIWLKNIK